MFAIRLTTEVLNVTVWLNLDALLNMLDIYLIVLVGNDNGFSPSLVALPLLNAVQPSNMFDMSDAREVLVKVNVLLKA